MIRPFNLVALSLVPTLRVRTRKDYDAGRVVYGWHSLAALLVWIAFHQAVYADPPTVNYLFPAGAQRGTTVTVTAGGSFPEWPVEVTCEEAGISVKALEKKGEFEVAVAGDCPSGLYQLEFPAKKDETNTRPFVVDSLPEVDEGERNDDPLSPRAIDGNVTVSGRFSKRGDVDTFAVELDAGETVVAAMQADWKLTSPIDAVLQVCDERGFPIEQNHDARGLDPLIMFTAPAAGKYLIRGFAFPSKPNSTIGFSGSDDSIYRLTITKGGLLSHTMPLAIPRGGETEVSLICWNSDPVMKLVQPNENAENVLVSNDDLAGAFPVVIAEHPVVVPTVSIADQPLAIEVPCDISATLAKPGEQHAFRFSAKKDDQLEFKLQSRAFGFPLDAVLQLADANSGDILSRVDDSNKQFDPLLTYTIKTDGEYEVRVSDLNDRGGMRFAYRLIAAFAKAK